MKIKHNVFFFFNEQIIINLNGLTESTKKRESPINE